MSSEGGKRNEGRKNTSLMALSGQLESVGVADATEQQRGLHFADGLT